MKIKIILKTIKIIILTSIIGLFSSCGRNDNPRSVAEKYFNAINAQEFEAAREYGTQETVNLLNMMIAFKKMSADSTFQEIKFEILREKITGENAIVFYKEEGKEGELKLPMIKEDGKWKVIQTKESINNSDPSMDIGATNLDSASKK
jgi:hypothetical protein